MNFTDYRTALLTLLVINDPQGQANLDAILPRASEYANLRMLRDPDLDFLYTRTSNSDNSTFPGLRSVEIPPLFVVVEGVSIILPALTRPTQSAARRVPLLRATREFIDMTWPMESMVRTPEPYETYYCIFNEEQLAPSDPDEPVPLGSSIIIAPTPDGEYRAEFTGTYRPAPLSDSVTTTFLGDNLPDLYLSATMIWLTGYQRDWGAQSDDPRSALSWEAVYQKQKEDAAVEEARKKFQGAGWSAYGVPGVANQPRTSLPPPPQPQGPA